MACCCSHTNPLPCLPDSGVLRGADRRPLCPPPFSFGLALCVNKHNKVCLFPLGCSFLDRDLHSPSRSGHMEILFPSFHRLFFFFFLISLRNLSHLFGIPVYRSGRPITISHHGQEGARRRALGAGRQPIVYIRRPKREKSIHHCVSARSTEFFLVCPTGTTQYY